jgi:hypothetical protein
MTDPQPDSLPPKRPRKGGRKPGPIADKQRHTVSVRLTDAEYWRLTMDATKYNRKLGEVLRAVWLNQHSVTKLPVPPTPERAKQIAQLADMADDLSKLTRQGGHGENISKGLLVVLKKMHALLT